MPTLTRAAAIDREIGTLTDELLIAGRHYRSSKALYAARRTFYDRKHGGVSVEADIGVRDDYRAKRAAADCTWYGSEVERLGIALSALIAVRGGRRADDDERDWHLAPREADEGFAINRPGGPR